MKNMAACAIGWKWWRTVARCSTESQGTLVMVEDAFGYVCICSTVLPSYWQEQYRVRSSMPWGKRCQVLPSITKYCLALQEECRAYMPGGRHCQADELSGDLGSATHEALISASFTHPFPTSKHHYHSNTSLWNFSTTVWKFHCHKTVEIGGTT